MSKRLGMQIHLKLSEYGPDATRWYMISNANPWDNLKFDLEELLRCVVNFLEHCTTPIRSLVCMLI
jgi:leucyl-tRNA synthetase